MLLLRSEDQQ